MKDEASSTTNPYICQTCLTYVNKKEESPVLADTATTTTTTTAAACCVVCQNLWQPNRSILKSAIQDACRVYGGGGGGGIDSINRFSEDIVVSIAGEIHLNYKHYYNYFHPSPRLSSSSLSFQTFVQDLKLFLSLQIQNIVTSQSPPQSPPPILSIASKEQQGYLSIYLLCIPSKQEVDNIHNDPNKKKKRRTRHRTFTTQGGDPKTNLETRLQEDGYQWQSMTSVASTSTTSTTSTASTTTDPRGRFPMEFHIAVHRKPIYLQGYYTKHRRDVSQSPFVVMKEERNENNSNKKQKVTLGISSVEEQICNPLMNQFLLGVSTQNNLPKTDPTKIFGMCKFHASGREDMDVRMLLRDSTILGRPFCIQVIDALRPLTSQQQLDDLVATINCDDDRNDDHSLLSSPQWHGKNPMGVGIAPNKLHMVPASAFSNLQADTESKVKHYGCHCWSECVLPPILDDDGMAQLFPNLKLPLTIQQKTPVRVVHRRANLVRERQILNLAVTKRIDDHHFRLELSTQAGTYVKEFVHGDLLRTKPSISSLMGCKVNILLLDCEGIQLGETEDDDTNIIAATS